MKNIKMIFILAITLVLTNCFSISKNKLSTNRPLLTNSEVCKDGSIREGYIVAVTNSEGPCPKGIQTCISGYWQGPELYQVCENHTKNCDGYPHGSIINGYSQSFTTNGNPCVPAFKTCNNGNWVGPAVYPSCQQN